MTEREEGEGRTVAGHARERDVEVDDELLAARLVDHDRGLLRGGRAASQRTPKASCSAGRCRPERRQRCSQR